MHGLLEDTPGQWLPDVRGSRVKASLFMRNQSPVTATLVRHDDVEGLRCFTFTAGRTILQHRTGRRRSSPRSSAVCLILENTGGHCDPGNSLAG